MKSLLPLPAAPKDGQRVTLPLLAGSADALVLAQLADGKHLLTIVAATPLEAQRLYDEIGWFAPSWRVHLLPDWETLPYDHFSPHQDLISERLVRPARMASFMALNSFCGSTHCQPCGIHLAAWYSRRRRL